jgi:hypothetical protein
MTFERVFLFLVLVPLVPLYSSLLSACPVSFYASPERPMCSPISSGVASEQMQRTTPSLLRKPFSR